MFIQIKLIKYIDIPLLSIIAIAALLRIAFLSNLPYFDKYDIVDISFMGLE
jgi:hypothetical protein